MEACRNQNRHRRRQRRIIAGNGTPPFPSLAPASLSSLLILVATRSILSLIQPSYATTKGWWPVVYH
ncbi:hypothetical protein Hanom_Chr03g00194581 [Helianthus anomalus]